MEPGKTAAVGAVGAKAAATGALWTFPAVLFSAFVISWGAEAAQFIMSQGLALAILAWLQTLPEFAVEAAIAWSGKVDMMTANFTGSLRLLVGLGWPMIYFVMVFFGRHRRKPGEPLFRPLRLHPEHAISLLALVPPMLYFVIILIKHSLHPADSIFLFAFYLGYLWLLFKLPPQDQESIDEMEAIPRYIISRKPLVRNLLIASTFIVGGIILYLTVEPFIASMMGLAVLAGVSPFVFVQWVAPFLSEFPEKLSAFNWARRVSDAPMAMMNMVSSNVNQWTVLAGMIPLVYSVRMHAITAVPFDHAHLVEIGLTIMQSFLGLMFLLEMKFDWWEAAGLFVLWLVQFCVPTLREEMLIVYGIFILLEAILYATGRKKLTIFKALRGVKFKETRKQRKQREMNG
jgi:cation:H+ antiporter